MTQDRRTWSEEDTAEVEAIIAPAAIERALTIYRHLQPRDQSVIVQARKILTQRSYGMVDLGEEDLRTHAFTFDWERVVNLDTHLSNLASKSYIAELGAGVAAFLDEERRILSGIFPDGRVTEQFSTLLIAALPNLQGTIADHA